MIELVEDTYGAYLCPEPAERPTPCVSSRRQGGLAIADSLGRTRPCADESDAAFAAIEAVVRHVTDRLAGRGVFAIHAASLVRDGRGIIICGRSRSGKTTLALALLASGFGLLSDEFALSDPGCPDDPPVPPRRPHPSRDAGARPGARLPDRPPAASAERWLPMDSRGPRSSISSSAAAWQAPASSTTSSCSGPEAITP